MTEPDHPEEGAIYTRCPECGGYHKPPDSEAFDALVREACASVGASVQPLYQEFIFSGGGDRWDTEPDAGLIRWTNGEGRISAARYQFVGGWIEYSGSFLWGWDSPHTTEATGDAARRVRDHGEANGFPELTTPYLWVGPEAMWHLADICAYLFDLPGVYRMKVNDRAYSYIAFDQPHWVH